MNSRRRFVKVSTAALGAALLPAGRVWASESPEVSAMKFGMIALTDCSPIVIAHEKGLFKKYAPDLECTEIQHEEGTGVRPAALVSFERKKFDSLGKLALRLNGLFWKQRRLSCSTMIG